LNRQSEVAMRARTGERSRRSLRGFIRGPFTIMMNLLVLLALLLLLVFAAAVRSVDGAVHDAWRRSGHGHRRADRSFHRSLSGTLILEIAARFPVRAGTIAPIAQNLRKRLSMHNRAGEMYNMHARAGPCRALLCD
jgi:hypothetical protein